MSTTAFSGGDQTFLQPFLSESFEPTAFLNSTLPEWSSSASTHRQQGTVTLAELSNQTQALLSQLNAHITRLSATLTQLTDEILRSGGRLAYEVEILRSDAAVLSDVLTENLRNDVQKFLPNGLSIRPDRRRSSTYGATPPIARSIISSPDEDRPLGARDSPEYVKQLHVLTTVRSRLDEVIKVFGNATEWILPPSEVSSRPSVLNSSTAESAKDRATREAKGKEYAEGVRNEISDLLAGSEAGGEEAAFQAATRRVEALRDLCTVWKGTVEEKGRTKFVDGLQKMVQDRQSRP